jgi:hypothetical protein
MALSITPSPSYPVAPSLILVNPPDSFLSWHFLFLQRTGMMEDDHAFFCRLFWLNLLSQIASAGYMQVAERLRVR